MSNPYLDKLLSLDPDWALGYDFRTVGTDRIWDDDSGATGDYDIVLNGGTERTESGPTNDPDARWVYFDGTASDYGEAAEGITGLTDFTMAMWVRTPDRTQSTAYLFGSYYAATNDRSWALQHRSSEYVIIYSQTGSTASGGVKLQYFETELPVNDTWEHIVITRSGSTMTLYKNGVSAETETNSDTFYSTADAFFSLATVPGASSRFDGDIYAPALWTSALTATEVEELYDAASEEPAGDALTASLADTVGVTDALSADRILGRSITDTAGISDALTTARTLARSIDDTAGLTDIVAWSLAASRSIDDSVGVTDSLTAQIAAALIEASISDTVGLTDALAQTRAIHRIVADTAGVSDITATARAISRLLDDIAGTTDSVTVSRAISRLLADTAGLTDTMDATVARMVAAAIADSVGVIDGLQTIIYTDAVTMPLITLAPRAITRTTTLAPDGITRTITLGGQ